MSLRKQIPDLLKKLTSGANSFQDYSIRSYINRRVNQQFSNIEKQQSEQKLQSFIEHWNNQLEIINRQAIVQNLYFTRSSILEKKN